MDWSAYEDVWIDPERMSGAPCLKGTRVTPESVLDNYDSAVEDGLTAQEAALLVHSYFPSVTVQQISNLVAYCEAQGYVLQS